MPRCTTVSLHEAWKMLLFVTILQEELCKENALISR